MLPPSAASPPNHRVVPYIPAPSSSRAMSPPQLPSIPIIPSTPASPINLTGVASPRDISIPPPLTLGTPATPLPDAALPHPKPKRKPAKQWQTEIGTDGRSALEHLYSWLASERFESDWNGRYGGTRNHAVKRFNKSLKDHGLTARRTKDGIENKVGRRFIIDPHSSPISA